MYFAVPVLTACVTRIHKYVDESREPLCFSMVNSVHHQRYCEVLGYSFCVAGTADTNDMRRSFFPELASSSEHVD